MVAEAIPINYPSLSKIPVSIMARSQGSAVTGRQEWAQKLHFLTHNPLGLVNGGPIQTHTPGSSISPSLIDWADSN